MTNKNLSAHDYIKIISKIEREDSNFEKMQEFLINFAKSRSLKFVTDDFKNVIIYKSTLNSVSPIAIQTQMDYVSVKTNKARFFSFQKGIILFKKGAYLFARKTNFGATSLAGMALILELLDSDNPVNIEAIFTTNSETMIGAKGLNEKNIESREMICLDGFCDALINSSSAIFANYMVRFPCEKEFIFNSPELKTFHLCVFGLANGLIGENPKAVNSTKLVTELLSKIEDVKINNLTTKNKLNVVPNRTDCVFTTTLSDIALKKLIKHFLILCRKTNKFIQIKCSRQINQTLVLDSFHKALNFIKDLEQGIVVDDERGKVIQNLSEVDSENGTLSVQILSTDEKTLKTQIKYLDDLCDKYGFSGGIVDIKPSFESIENSTLVKDLEESYVGLTPLKKDVLLKASQAGIFQEKIKSLDIANLSICVNNPFSTEEKLLISSVKNTSLWLKNFFEKKSLCK
ncbi:MAG: hypothetical protein EOM55_02350 [Clostridia bacterium]|nr:hypothetical protein [Clostridia bacterium]